MARTMNIDNTDIYRMVVDYKYYREPDSSIFQDVYGPHDSSNQARDHDGYRKGPARLRKQKLKPTDLRDLYPDGLVWQTIKTTYTNGGEDVNWDEDVRGA